MVQNKEEERRLPVPATRREWVWDPMTSSVEGPTALTTGETNGQHGYCRPSPILTPQQVFSFVCRHQPSELLPVPSPSQAPGASPGSAPADSSAYYGSMSARHQPRPPWLVPTAVSALGAKPSSCAQAHYRPDSHHWVHCHVHACGEILKPQKSRPAQLRVGLDFILCPVTGLYR